MIDDLRPAGKNSKSIRGEADDSATDAEASLASLAAPLIGTKITLDDSTTLKICRACGSYAGIVTPGAGPHIAGVRCDGCGRFVGWLSKGMAQVLLARRA